MPKVPRLDAAEARALGLRLRRARDDAGMTQENAAHAAGISRNQLQLIEQGLGNRGTRSPANPHLAVLINLCDVLNLDLAQLYRDVWGPGDGPEVEYPAPAE